MNIGERVGDYEIVGILGAGGMGQVYKVRNILSDRVEAMKVLLPNLEGDSDLAERFLREIKVQAALDHPNIARLHTAQIWNNQLLMVMEYVEGITIEKLLENGAIGVRDSIAYIGQVLDALSYAHERGVVHRDLKPANIMRTSQGAIKLMDFGIARMQSDRRLTQTGHTVGSLFYMSPEQINGSQPDPRSDLYSLGITMYEMVTGRKPFEGTSDFSIMAAHLQQLPVAPIDVIPGIPQELSEIILMAVAKEPGARFQSAAAFKGALASIRLGGPVAPTMVVPPSAPHAVHPQVPPQFAPQYPPVGPPAPPQQPYFPPPPAYPPPPKKQGSPRGLYMTLGSLATVGVIVAAVFLVPYFRRAGATPGNTQVVTDAPQDAPRPIISPSDGKDGTSGRGGDFQTPRPVTPTPVTPAPVQPTPVTPTPVSPTPVAPTPVTPTPVQPTPVQPTPVQPKPVVQPPPPQPVAVVKPVAVDTPELRELRELYNLIAGRAASAKNGVRQMETQIRRQGLDMRGDILDAENRMDILMKESMDSIRAGDAVNGRRNLQMAERALETIEKFLGR